MYSFSKTQLKREIFIGSVIVLALIVAVSVFVAAMLAEPDIIDQNEIVGAPSGLSEDDGYVSYGAAGVCNVSLCCEPAFDGKKADIFLTNPQENEVLVKASFYTVKTVVNQATGKASYIPDKLLGETGYIHPGTYVKSITLKNVPSGSATAVMVKISTIFEDTRLSNGIFYVFMSISKDSR